MTSQLAKSAISIQRSLAQLQLPCEILEFPSGTRTAVDAALAIGCDVKQIVKSLIFKTADTNKPVLVLASGANQVNLEQIQLYVGEKVNKADADFTRDVTGFAIGGIPPIGHKNMIEHIYIDQDLIELNEVWAAAGTPNTVFSIQSAELVKTTNGEVINIKEVK